MHGLNGSKQSIEHRKKISESLKNKKKSATHLLNQSLAQRGKKHRVSEEFRKSRSEALKIIQEAGVNITALLVG